MIKKQKGSLTLIVLLIILFLVAAGGGAYYYYSIYKPSQEATTTPTQPTEETAEEAARGETEATADWQEYQNDTYNYKIKYPKEWYFHKTGYAPPPPTGIMVANVAEGQATGDYASLQVFVDQAMGRTLENYEEISSLESKGYTKSSTTISGQNAVRLERDTHPSDTGGYIYVKYGQYIYRITWGGTSKTVFQKHKTTLEQVIKSFTFVSSGTTEISLGPITISDLSQLQQSVDAGHQPLYLDPVEVARMEGTKYGFSLSDQFSLISKEYAEAAGTYIAEVKAVHNEVSYVIQLIQPETQGTGGIWAINSIRKE